MADRFGADWEGGKWPPGGGKKVAEGVAEGVATCWIVLGSGSGGRPGMEARLGLGAAVAGGFVRNGVGA